MSWFLAPKMDVAIPALPPMCGRPKVEMRRTRWIFGTTLSCESRWITCRGPSEIGGARRQSAGSSGETSCSSTTTSLGGRALARASLHKHLH